jgi:hypothetical protein
MDQRVNTALAYIASVLSPIYQRIRKDIERNSLQLSECIAIVPLILIYAYETKIMIILIVLFLYVYVALQPYLHDRIRNTTEMHPSIKRAFPLYLVLFLWFLLSKIWSGPSYAQDCIWLQPQIEWILFFSVLIQNAVLFLPPHSALDFLWMFNYVYPERSMISTCASLYVLLLRALGLTTLWVLSPNDFRIRSLGLFLVNAWYGVPFFAVAWTFAYLRYVSQHEKVNL